MLIIKYELLNGSNDTITLDETNGTYTVNNQTGLLVTDGFVCPSCSETSKSLFVHEEDITCEYCASIDEHLLSAINLARVVKPSYEVEHVQDGRFPKRDVESMSKATYDTYKRLFHDDFILAVDKYVRSLGF